MMEVFVAFTRESNVADLKKTLEAWDLPNLQPVAIQVVSKKFEIYRRVTAENVSVGDYILCDLGIGPVEEEFGQLAQEALDKHPKAGMITPNGIAIAVICRKGIITHWPTPRTSAYQKEHAEAYERLGYQVISCLTMHCLPLAVCLPS